MIAVSDIYIFGFGIFGVPDFRKNWKIFEKNQQQKNATVPSADVVEMQNLFWGEFIYCALLPERTIYV